MVKLVMLYKKRSVFIFIITIKFMCIRCKNVFLTRFYVPFYFHLVISAKMHNAKIELDI